MTRLKSHPLQPPAPRGNSPPPASGVAAQTVRRLYIKTAAAQINCEAACIILKPYPRGADKP